MQCKEGEEKKMAKRNLHFNLPLKKTKLHHKQGAGDVLPNIVYLWSLLSS